MPNFRKFSRDRGTPIDVNVDLIRTIEPGQNSDASTNAAATTILRFDNDHTVVVVGRVDQILIQIRESQRYQAVA